MFRFFLVSFSLLLCTFSFAQIPHEHPHERAIQFPDIPGYLTLSGDFHIHTVFSDGSVWPNIRVQEALRDSLDAIAVTEHIEYQPHLNDIPHPDRNRSFEVAQQAARAYDLIVVNGSEITRAMPPGHVNAIFVEDANALMVKDSEKALEAAKDQGAFTFWNHPNWVAQYSDGIARETKLHKRLFKKGLIMGIEVVNDVTYSDEALQIALDYDLTIMGTSDIHGLVDWQFKIPEGGHRPVTLIFAKERSAEAIKEGLMEHKTVVWYNNTLIGREEWLVPLIKSCLQIEKVAYQGAASVANVTIHNPSDCEFILTNESKYSLHTNTDIVIIHPNSSTTIQVKTLEQLKAFELKFTVLNGILAPNKHPEVSLKVQVN